MNQVGREGGNTAASQGRDIPWLQETADQDVWGDWAVSYRDVIILTPSNEVHAVYNLSVNNLAVAENRETLKSLLRNAGR